MQPSSNITDAHSSEPAVGSERVGEYTPLHLLAPAEKGIKIGIIAHVLDPTLNYDGHNAARLVFADLMLSGTCVSTLYARSATGTGQ